MNIVGCAAEVVDTLNFFAGQADVGGCRFNVLARNLEIPTAAMLRDLAPFLRGVVFVGKAALRGGFDFQRVSVPCPRKAP